MALLQGAQVVDGAADTEDLADAERHDRDRDVAARGDEAGRGLGRERRDRPGEVGQRRRRLRVAEDREPVGRREPAGAAVDEHERPLVAAREAVGEQLLQLPGLGAGRDGVVVVDDARQALAEGGEDGDEDDPDADDRPPPAARAAQSRQPLHRLKLQTFPWKAKTRVE